MSNSVNFAHCRLFDLTDFSLKIGIVRICASVFTLLSLDISCRVHFCKVSETHTGVIHDIKWPPGQHMLFWKFLQPAGPFKMSFSLVRKAGESWYTALEGGSRSKWTKINVKLLRRNIVSLDSVGLSQLLDRLLLAPLVARREGKQSSTVLYSHPASW